MNATVTAATSPLRPSCAAHEAWLTPLPISGAHRLIVFPHAGAGTASYVRLARDFGAIGIEVAIVRYPGRENRMGEPLVSDLGMLVERLASDLAPLARGHFSLLGHSMGALVAFELAHAWRERHAAPHRLWISGRRAPEIPADLPHLHTLPDRELLLAVQRRYQALPDAVLAHPELVEMMLPVLRADFSCVETYRCPPRSPLAVPLSVLRGTADRWVDDTARTGWARHTTNQTDEHVFSGGHFYLDQNLPALVHLIGAVCRSVDGAR